MENAAPEIRASALLSLNVKKALCRRPPAIGDGPHRRPERDGASSGHPGGGAASIAGRRSRLLELAAKPGSPDYATAVEALCGLPDPRAMGVYLAALEDSNPRLRKLATSALLAIRDKNPAELDSAAQSAGGRASRLPWRSTACWPGSRRSRAGTSSARFRA